MTEIRYGEYYEMADLAGKSVAQAREQYKQEFGIPDKAQAKLNGKGIRQRQEPKIALSHNDSLTFAQKSRKGLFFIGAILLALVITGGVFAWGATTTTVTLTITEKPDFVAVTAGGSPPTWNAFGSTKGSVGTGTLFDVNPDDDWTGDVSIILTIANAQDLVEAYRILVLKIEVQDSLGNPIAGPDYLSLGKGDVDFDVTYDSDEPWTVEVTGGYYITHKAGAWSADPVIMCQVLQREAP